MQKPFEDAAFALKVGVEDNSGWRDVVDCADGFRIPSDPANRMRI